MREVDCIQWSEKILGQLKQGAFLTVKSKDENLNTMTISWGSLGIMWFKPVFMVMVRGSRHTYNLIENSDEFTVSFPLNGQLKKELEICGTKSGRDIDKFKVCNLTQEHLNNIETPVIKECDIHLGCKILDKQPMNPTSMDEELHRVYGAGKDYHTLYYGEIVACSVKEGLNI